MPRFLFACCACLCFSISSAAEPEWRGWRGPEYSGHSDDSSLPVTWTPDDVVWRTPLKGKGQSCPVVVGDRIFVTSALDNGRERIVTCLNRKTGEEVWVRTAWKGEPEATHQMNGWASSTCAADGERVYAFFGKGGGLFCYTLDGEKLWQHELGEFAGPWGTAAAPLLFENLLIQNCDAEVDAFIIGIDKVTGEQVWKTKRRPARGWSSPIPVEVDGHTEIVVNGEFGVQAYDPESGRELWFCKSFNGRGTPTVTVAGELLHVVNGKRGDTYAIRPGGSGDVTQTHMVWHTRRNSTRDLPSPIVLGDQSLVMDMRRAAITAYDYTSGEELWMERVADAGSVGQFCATPVAWNGVAFFVSESGSTFAIRGGDAMEVVSVNTVDAGGGEIFRSSITPDKGQLLLRSDSALYCIGK